MVFVVTAQGVEGQLVPPELTQRAAVEGTVPVIVHLAMAVTPEGVLADESAVLGQRQGIANAQRAVPRSRSRSRGARYPRYLDGNGPASGRGRAGASSARPERSARSGQRSMEYGLHRQRQGDRGPGLRYRQSSSLLGWQGRGGGVLLRQQQLPEWLEDPDWEWGGCPLHLRALRLRTRNAYSRYCGGYWRLLFGCCEGREAYVGSGLLEVYWHALYRWRGPMCIVVCLRSTLGSNASIRYGTSTPSPPST